MREAAPNETIKQQYTVTWNYPTVTNIQKICRGYLPTTTRTNIEHLMFIILAI